MPAIHPTQASSAGWIGRIGVVLGLIGAAPLILMTFFSPGLRSEGIFGALTFAWVIVTLCCLLVAALRARAYWVLVLIQLLLIIGALIEIFSDSKLYIGT